MTAEKLLKWLVAHGKQRLAVPIDELDAGWVDALVALQERRKVHLSEHEGRTLIWIDPGVFRRRGQARCDRPEILETDLPPDVPYLKHAPDRDSMPVSGMRLNGEPVYRPRDEPSSLVAMGSTPWPPDGTSINCRKYREHRAQYTEVAIWDLHVVADACPVCGKPDGRKPGATSNNVNCVVCDLWARDVRKCVRTFEPEPDCQPEAESKPKRKKGAKAG